MDALDSSFIGVPPAEFSGKSVALSCHRRAHYTAKGTHNIGRVPEAVKTSAESNLD
jgi:hypothetical protein